MKAKSNILIGGRSGQRNNENENEKRRVYREKAKINQLIEKPVTSMAVAQHSAKLANMAEGEKLMKASDVSSQPQ